MSVWLVISDPIEAEVAINGQKYGTTPTTIENLLIGDYEVVLSKDGCATQSRRVTITENNLSIVNANLQVEEKSIQQQEEENQQDILPNNDKSNIKGDNKENKSSNKREKIGLTIGILANTAAPSISLGYCLGKNVGVPGLTLGLEVGLVMDEDFGLAKIAKVNAKENEFEETLAYRAGIFITKEFNFARNFVFTPSIGGGLILGASEFYSDGKNIYYIS